MGVIIMVMRHNGMCFVLGIIFVSLLTTNANELQAQQEGEQGAIMAGDRLKEADALWGKRDDYTSLVRAIEIYEDALKSRPRDTGLLTRLSRAYAWAGNLLPMDEKKERYKYFRRGSELGDRVIEIDPDNIEAYFWKTVNEGRYTETKGILSGHIRLGATIKALTIVATKDPGFYYGGVFRYWGRAFFRIPWVAKRVIDFTLEDSVWFLKRSIELEPRFFESHYYLAETYIKMDKEEEAEKELKWIIDMSPDVLPEVAPENRRAQRDARELLKSLR